MGRAKVLQLSGKDESWKDKIAQTTMVVDRKGTMHFGESQSSDFKKGIVPFAPSNWSERWLIPISLCKHYSCRYLFTDD